MASSEARGVDLEIIEKVHSNTDKFGNQLVIPTAVRINGVEVLMPDDATIDIDPISSKSYLRATLTVMLNSLVVRREE